MSVATVQKPASDIDWLKTRSASAGSLRPTACETSAIAPTPSVCVTAITTNIAMPAAPTPASAASPSCATKYRSIRK